MKKEIENRDYIYYVVEENLDKYNKNQKLTTCIHNRNSYLTQLCKVFLKKHLRLRFHHVNIL